MRFLFSARSIFLILLLGILGFVLWLPPHILLGSRDLDLPEQFVAWRAFAAANLRAGHFPLWNPYTFSGQPFLGGFQSQLFYPPSLLYLVLPLPQALNFSLLLHLAILGFGMRRWAVRRGLHPWAAGLAGLASALGGTVFPHIFAGHLPNLCTLAWTPWVFDGLEHWLRSGRARGIIQAALAVCLQVFAGHVQYAFYTGVASAFLMGVWGLEDRSLRQRALRGLVSCYLLGALLAAAQVLPGFAATGESIRQGPVGFGFASMFSFPPENLITAWAPGFFGGLARGLYWGRCYWWEMSVFIGVTGCVLLCIGCLDRPRRHEVRRDVLVATILFVFALGAHTALFSFLYRYVPGFDRFRGLSKFTFPASLFVLMIVAGGADCLIRRRACPRGVASTACACAGFFAAMGAWLYLHPAAIGRCVLWIKQTHESYVPWEAVQHPGFVQLAGIGAARSLLIAAALLALNGGALWLAKQRPQARWLPLFLLPVELIAFAGGSFAFFRTTDVLPGELPAFVADHPGDYRVLDLARPNNGYLLGAPDIWGGDPGVTKRYAEFMTFTQGGDPNKASQNLEIRFWHPLYALLRQRFSFVPTDAGLSVIEAPSVLPHAYLAENYVVQKDRDAIFGALSAPGFDPRATVVLEKEPSIPRGANDLTQSEVLISHETTDGFDVEVTTASPAILVVTDLYSKNWRARALPGSGQAAYEVVPADYIVRGIPLGAGHHFIRVEYVLSSFRTGMIISALTWFGLAAGVFFWAVRQRKVSAERSA